MPPMPGQEQRAQQKFLIFDQFEKMNTQAARTGLPDKQLAWLENMQPLAANKLQVVPAPASAPFQSIPENITLAFYATMNGQDWAVLFTTAGGGWFINFTNATAGQFAPDGTFSTAPDCTVWQAQRILINDSISGYCTWDGVSLFVRQGGLSPNMQVTNGGANYSTPPPVSILIDPTTRGLPGGVALLTISNAGAMTAPGAGTHSLTFSAPPAGGTLAAGTCIVSGSSPNLFVSSVTITNPGAGYLAPPTVTLAGATPAGGAPVFVAQLGIAGLGAIQITTPGAFSTPSAGTVNLTIGAPPTGGVQATATATLTGTSPNVTVASINITNPGSGYSAPPSVTLSTTGGTPPVLTGVLGANGATAVSQLGTGPAQGQVIGLQLTGPGSGFNASDLVILQFGSTSGSGAAISVRSGTGGAAGVNGMSGSGLSTVTINSIGQSTGAFPPGGGPGPGGSYPLVVSAPPAGGTQAVVWFTTIGNAAGNTVNSIVIGNVGAGYASPPSIVTPNAGAGWATIPSFTAVMAPQHVQSPLTLSAGGSGYPASATIPLVFTGDSAIAQAQGTATTNTSGVVTSVALTSGGSYPLNTSRPTVGIAAGQGAAGSAHVWPFVPAGTTLAVFQGRVWLGGGTLLQWSGTGASYGNVAYDDFLPQDASGSLNITDADLVHKITALRSLNNYLWIMGDQSVKQIGNISVSGAVTQFTLLTLSSDQGTVWPKSCISFNRIFLFANPNGIFGVFGSTVQKISDDLDGIFQNASFAQQPQGAILDLNSKHNAAFLVRYNDPVAGTRSLLLLFDGARWWLANQGSGIVAIVTYPNAGSDLNNLFASLASTDLTQLFTSPSTAVAFKVRTALSHHGNPVQGKKVIRAGFTAGANSSTDVGITVEADTATPTLNELAVTSSSLLVGGANDANSAPINAAGVYIGATVSGTLANFTLQNVILEYQETSLWKGA